MRIAFSYLFLLFPILGNNFQQKDTWVISLDNKKIHEGVEQSFNEKMPSVSLLASQLRTHSFLEIAYREAPTNIPWKRSFLFCDEKNKVVARSDFNQGHGKFSIPVSSFGIALRKIRKLSLYTEQSPQNTDMMIRSKRISICVLELH